MWLLNDQIWSLLQAWYSHIARLSHRSWVTQDYMLSGGQKLAANFLLSQVLKVLPDVVFKGPDSPQLFTVLAVFKLSALSTLLFVESSEGCGRIF